MYSIINRVYTVCTVQYKHIKYGMYSTKPTVNLRYAEYSKIIMYIMYSTNRINRI